MNDTHEHDKQHVTQSNNSFNNSDENSLNFLPKTKWNELHILSYTYDSTRISYIVEFASPASIMELDIYFLVVIYGNSASFVWLEVFPMDVVLIVIQRNWKWNTLKSYEWMTLCYSNTIIVLLVKVYKWKLDIYTLYNIIHKYLSFLPIAYCWFHILCFELIWTKCADLQIAQHEKTRSKNKIKK